MGDARYNMGNSLMIGCAKMGLHFVACAPKAYWPNPELVTRCEEFARLSGGSVTLTEDTDAAAGADAVYTDVWVSMGEPTAVWEERINALAPYQVNAALMAKAKRTAVFMHCLPAYHDHKTAIGREMGERFGRAEMEVTDEVFTGRQSIVFQEAENRMHTIKAVMAANLRRVTSLPSPAGGKGGRAKRGRMRGGCIAAAFSWPAAESPPPSCIMQAGRQAADSFPRRGSHANKKGTSQRGMCLSL